MTEKGISVSKKIAESKAEAVGIFLKSLESLQPRVSSVCKLELKECLQTSEQFVYTSMVSPAIGIKGLLSSTELSYYLPEKVKDSIAKLHDALFESNLSASRTGIATCPEIRSLLLDGTDWVRDEHARAHGLKTVRVDEYLNFLINGIRLVNVKALMLQCFYCNRGELFASEVKEYSRKFGVPVNLVLEWLMDLKNCAFIDELDKNAMEPFSIGDARSFRTKVVARGAHTRECFESPFEDLPRLKLEVRNRIENWFETGEEVFQRFEFKRSLISYYR